MKVPPPKAIYRLFRVTDQDHGFRGCLVEGVVNPIEDAVLNGVGILKFIDESDRELLPNDCCKMVPIRSLKCGIKSG